MSTFRALLVLSFVLISSHLVEAQAVRYDYFASTTSAQCAPGKQCPLNVLPGTQVNICGGAVTNMAACLSSPATTYTNAGAGTPCATTSQLTPQTGGSCRATSDNQGNYGFWILPGSYNYFLRVPVTAGGGTYGPYPISIGASAGCPLAYATCDANFQTLQAAVDAAGSGVLYIGRTWTPTASVIVSQPLTITCNPNGVIKAGVNAFSLVVSSNVTVQGCTFSGNNAAHPTWLTGLISASGASSVTLNTVTFTDAANSIGVASINSPNLTLLNVNCTAGLPCVRHWADTGSGDNIQISGGTFIMPAGSTGGGPIAIQTVGTSAGGHIVGVGLHNFTISSGGDNAQITVQGLASGAGPDPIRSVDIGGLHMKALAGQFGGISLGGTVNDATVHDNDYDLNGFTAFIQYEGGQGDNQNFHDNISRNTVSGSSTGIFKDAGGKKFRAHHNTLTANFGIGANSGNGAAAGADLLNYEIDHNTITSLATGDICIAVGTSGASTNNRSGLIDSNTCNGFVGNTREMFQISTGASGSSGTDDIKVLNNQGTNFPAIIATPNLGAGLPSNIVMRGNKNPDATGECVGGCGGSVVDRDNIGFPRITTQSVSAAGVIATGAAPTVIIQPGGSGSTETCPNTHCTLGSFNTPYSGVVSIVTTGVPAAASFLFTLTVPSGIYANAPLCSVSAINTAGADLAQTQLQYSLSTSTATLQKFATGATAMTTANTYVVIWNCTKN